MSTDQLQFPPIVDTPKPVAGVVTTIKDAAIAHLRAREPEIRALAERYRAVALDLSTPKGMAVGKAARLDLRENGRLALQRGRDATKDLLNAAKADVVAEADRLIAIVKPIEDHVHGQIEARETQLAVEKAERDRIEAERVAKHQAGIQRIRGYAAQGAGKTSDRIAAGIAFVEGLAFGAEWEEFAVPAANAQCETLEALRALLRITKEREDEAAERERQRIEYARIAEEQRVEAQRLADERSALEAERRKIAEAQVASAAPATQFDRDLQRESPRQVAAPEPAEREPVIIPPHGVYVSPGTPGARFVNPAPRVVEVGPPTLNVGAIGRRFGVVMTSDFILNTLKVPASATVKGNSLWTESSFQIICSVLGERVRAVAAEHAREEAVA